MAHYDYLPTATLEDLQARSRLLRAVREFFEARAYWEVDTPTLSHDIVIDAWLEPFVVERADGGRPMYLQTSPEFAMKRLLAAGADAIYQIGHVFRFGESGRRHNPEFTMIEWYRQGDSHHAQMTFVEELTRAVFAAAGNASIGSSPFRRTTYRAAFEQHLAIDVFETATAGLRTLATDRDLSIPPSLADDDRDGWLNLLLAECIEPRLGVEMPEFLYHYPASQGALAQIGDEHGHPVAERFELYVRGIELCNGYHELLDADELRRRNVEQSAIRAREGNRALPGESRLLDAMDAGLPACAGVALGFDRLVMLALGRTSIADVIAFPFARA